MNQPSGSIKSQCDPSPFIADVLLLSLVGRSSQLYRVCICQINFHCSAAWKGLVGAAFDRTQGMSGFDVSKADEHYALDVPSEVCAAVQRQFQHHQPRQQQHL